MASLAWAWTCTVPNAAFATGPLTAPAEHLHCEIRYASQSWHLDATPTDQPLLVKRHDVGRRFAFRAIARASQDHGGRIAHVTTQVFDLEAEQKPLVQQFRRSPPWPEGSEVPALTGWQHVYSGVLGRELVHGCVVRAGPPPGVADVPVLQPAPAGRGLPPLWRPAPVVPDAADVPRLMPDLPADILAKYQAIHNIAVVCVIAKLRKPVTENFWLNTNDPEMDIPGLVEYSNLRPLDQHIVYVPFYMPGEHPKFADDNQVFLDKVRRYLKKINPSLTDEDFLDIRASRYRHAQPICDPGYLENLPPARLPVAGLWVADTSYYYPEDRGISESIGYGRNMAREAAA